MLVERSSDDVNENTYAKTTKPAEENPLALGVILLSGAKSAQSHRFIKMRSPRILILSQLHGKVQSFDA